MGAKGHLVNTYQQLLSLTWIWVGAGRGFSAVEQTKKDYYISVCRRPVNVLLVATQDSLLNLHMPFPAGFPTFLSLFF